MPSQTGLSVVTLPQYFKSAGYYTVGGGKIFHPGSSSGGPSPSEGGGDEPYSWSEPYFFCDHFRNGTFQSTAMQQWPSGTGCVQNEECIKCLESYGSWGNTTFDPAIVPSSCPSECYPEGAVTNYIRKTLYSLSSNRNSSNEPKQPFFVAVGLKRPHLGWFAPQSFFDLYPPETTDIATHRQPPINMPPIGFFMNNSELTNSYEFKTDKSLIEIMRVENGNVSDGYYRLVVDRYHSKLRSAYFASVSWMDDQLGSILDALQESGFWENTIIVFIGDHGYHLGENGAWAKNTPYEYSARVPMIFRVPGQMGNGSEFGSGSFAVKDIVEMVDIYPTVLEAAGLNKNPSNQGVSLMSYINGKRGSDYRALKENVAFTQTYQFHIPRGTPSMYLDVIAMSMRMHGWRYTEYVEYNWTTAQPIWEKGNFGVELYEHLESTENDWNSYEHYNLAFDEEYKQRVDDLHQYLVENWPYGPNITQQYPNDIFVSPEVSLYD